MTIGVEHLVICLLAIDDIVWISSFVKCPFDPESIFNHCQLCKENENGGSVMVSAVGWRPSLTLAPQPFCLHPEPLSLARSLLVCIQLRRLDSILLLT